MAEYGCVARIRGTYSRMLIALLWRLWCRSRDHCYTSSGTLRSQYTVSNTQMVLGRTLLRSCKLRSAFMWRIELFVPNKPGTQYFTLLLLPIPATSIVFTCENPECHLFLEPRKRLGLHCASLQNKAKIASILLSEISLL